MKKTNELVVLDSRGCKRKNALENELNNYRVLFMTKKVDGSKIKNCSDIYIEFLVSENPVVYYQTKYGNTRKCNAPFNTLWFDISYKNNVKGGCWGGLKLAEKIKSLKTLETSTFKEETFILPTMDNVKKIIDYVMNTKTKKLENADLKESIEESIK